MIGATLLGTSALLPLPERALTAALLTLNGRSILFDCGEGTRSAARRAGVSLMKTDLIALTHYHGDHIFGLPGLLQMCTLLSLPILRLYNGERGRLKGMKWFFYIYYPAHLFIIGIIRIALGGGSIFP
ncbi:MAG: MBL fold metallo-hydrolase [Clostridia bacterium]|nr:MBL fold metallo-hydrolase [Clostridia bacterium]